jgi:hypothetical protein
VLYLRPFTSDAHGDSTPPAVSGLYHAEGLITHEEHLASAFKAAGQFVAISAPSLSSHPLGAIRLAVADDQWQPTVRELLDRARLVVVRCGNTPGIIWELREILLRCTPQQVIVLLHADPAQSRWDHAVLAEMLETQVPLAGGIWNEYEGLAGICIFDDDWRPRLRLFRTVSGRESVFAPLVPPLRYALEPVFKRLQIPWKSPPLGMGVLTASAETTIVFFTRFGAHRLRLG